MKSTSIDFRAKEEKSTTLMIEEMEQEEEEVLPREDMEEAILVI